MKPTMKTLPFLSLLIIASCAHPGRKVQTKEKPQTMQEAMMRESTGLTPHKTTSSDNELEFTVQSRKAPVIELVNEKTSYHYVRIDIGAKAPMECYFYKGDISPATAIRSLTGLILSNKDVVGKVLATQTSMVGAGHIQGNPFLMLQTAFAVDDAGQRLTGNMKAMVATKDVGNVVCAHNEVGYQKTFADRFEEVVSSFEFLKAPKPPILYKDVIVLTLKNLPIGYVVNYLTGGGQVNTKGWISKTSFLLPSEQDVYADDDMSLELSTKNGIVAYGFYKSEQGGKLDHAVEIKTDDGKNYVVLGTKQDQKVETLMQTKAGVISNYEHTKLIKKRFVDQHLQQFTVPAYLPDTDAFKPTSLKTTLKKKNADGLLISIQSGKEVYTSVVRKDGGTEALKIPAGESEVEGKKVYSMGTL